VEQNRKLVNQAFPEKKKKKREGKQRKGKKKSKNPN